MKSCTNKQCKVYFKFLYPEQIYNQQQNKNLQNNNQTIIIKHYVDIKNYLPPQLAQVFQVLGLSVGVAYSGGYTSLMKILF
jgi:hypothetical protein